MNVGSRRSDSENHRSTRRFSHFAREPNTGPTDRAANQIPVLRIGQRPNELQLPKQETKYYKYIVPVTVPTEVNAVMKSCVLHSTSSCSLQTI